MLHEITIRVKVLRHLAQSFFQEERERELTLLANAKSDSSSMKSPGRRGGYRRCLRAGARIVNEARETGNSVWGKGMKAREAMWLRGAEKLSWRLSERQFKRVKAYRPACKVHVYAVDASAPTMDTSDAVGWFVVDMRDLAGQGQHEHWVKLQGASPAEVLISADLTMVRERSDSKKSSARISWDQSSRENIEEGRNAIYELKTDEVDCEGDVKLTAESVEESELELKPETEAEVDAESKEETEAEVEAEPKAERETDGEAESKSEAEVEATHPPRVEAIPEEETRENPEEVELFVAPDAEVASELDALPVGHGADGNDARVFSLSIAVKGASRLSGLAPHIGDSNGAGFWFSYSIFGVVLQTDRFEHLAAQPSGDDLATDEPVLEPMLDSFRLRATLPGLCAFLGEAPPLQVYLCTTGRILAHADVDMSLLLPRREWEGRNTSEFGRSGMEGDFVLRLPGESVAPGTNGRDDAVVTVCAELARASVIPTIGGQSETNDSSTGEVMINQEGRGNGQEKPSVITWAQLAPEPQRQRLVVKATLDRLELAPLPNLSAALDGGRGSILIGIQSLQGTSTLPTASGTIISLPKEGFRSVACNSDGGVKTEDSSALGAITWEWEGDLDEHCGNALAEVHVVGPGQGDVEIATGMIPWPSEVCSGQHYVDVALWSSDGTKVGSCRVCLVTGGRKDADNDRGADELDVGRIQGGPSSSVTFVEEESKLEDSQEAEQGGEGGEADKCQDPSAAMNAGATVSVKGVQAGEAPMEGEQDEAWGRVPRSYRLSINLASVKDFENAANVVAYYHYPHFGTSAPVRTSLAWVAPRMDTPLSNSCCTFSFGMSFDRLASTVRDHKLVVSIRNKDRLQEEQVGLTTVPLEELVKSKPQYFRCKNTNKTFTSMSGFRAYLEARQRSGGFSAQEASLLPPVEVKVLDSYLTVVSTIGPPTSSSFPSGGSSHPPSKLCSLRVNLVLEDMGPMGPTEHPRDERIQKGPDGVPDAQSNGVRTTGLGNESTMLPALEELRNDMSEGGKDLERVWRKWEQWRVAEEAGFAQRLREKDRALEAKWEARENVRRRDLAQAQTDYGKLETKLRKALSEIEARERALKAKEESWRSEHAQKLSELGLQQRRLREETRHQVVMERMKTKSLEKQLASQTKQLEDARARVASAEEDLERFKEKQRKTSEGSLRQELLLLGAAKAEAESQVERERSLKMKALLEKEEYRAHIHKLARALKRHQERESTCARREMEQLRLEYLAREERFMLDGDRNELRNMKQELDELRHLGLVQEAQASLASTTNGNIPAASISARTSNPRASGEGDGNGGRADAGVHGDVEAFFVPGPSPLPPPQPTPAPAQVRLRLDRSSASRRSGSESTNVSNKIPGVSGVASGGQEEGQVESLMEWRDCLLGTGIYTEQNPIVSELNRWIGAGGGQGRVARGECLREK